MQAISALLVSADFDLANTMLLVSGFNNVCLYRIDRFQGITEFKMTAAAPSSGQRVVAIAVDRSEQSEQAFDCTYNVLDSLVTRTAWRKGIPLFNIIVVTSNDKKLVHLLRRASVEFGRL